MKLLDSSLLIDYAQGHTAAADFLDRHDDAGFGAPTIVLSELYTGLFVTTGMDREAAKARYDWLQPVPFTNEAAVEAAVIRASLRDRGNPINTSDTYVAGTARALDVPLVTADDDFEKVEGVVVQRYRRE